MELFGDVAAILYLIVSNTYYRLVRGKRHLICPRPPSLPPPPRAASNSDLKQD